MIATRAADPSALELLERHLSILQCKVRGTIIEGLARELTAQQGPEPERSEVDHLVSLVVRIKQIAERAERDLEDVETRWQAMGRRYFAVSEPADRRRVLADYLVESVPDPRQRAADLAALDRALDHDALRERHAIVRHRYLVVIELAVTFMGRATASVLVPDASKQLRHLLDAAGIQDYLHEMAETGSRWQIRHTAFDGLVRISTVDRANAARLESSNLGNAMRSATNLDEHAWVQGEALHLVLVLSYSLGLDLVARRLFERGQQREDFLVRRQAIDLLVLDDDQVLAILRRAIAEPDPSEHVRQGVAEALARSTAPQALGWLRPLLGLDPVRVESSAKVRATAIAGACRAARTEPDRIPDVARLLIDFLARETATLPLTMACEETAALIASGPAAFADVGSPLVAALVELSGRRDVPPVVHEVAAAAAETATCALQPELRGWMQYLAGIARDLRPGRSRMLSLVPPPRGLPPLPDDPIFLGRILAGLSRRDFPLFATRRGTRIELWRGDQVRRRFWRILHELRSRAPTKRHAHRHTVGRRPRGQLRAPPGGLDEVTATLVPGERVFVPAEGGWGRHLPSVDDVLGLPLFERDPVRVFSSYGVTTIRQRGGLLSRLRNRLSISRRYAELAALRNQSLAGREPHERQRYLLELHRRYGIRAQLARYDYPAAGAETATPDHLAGLFPSPQAIAPGSSAAFSTAAFIAIPGFDQLGDWLDRNGYYLLSLRGNSQLALMMFLVAFAAIFFAGAFLKRQRIDRARAGIPLTIGGWGTRGKSSAERLKAAVFHGLGYEVFVKTTGCEAMLIHSVPDEAPHEVFIFRSYDKATIWEQRDMLELADSLGSEVYLWECMALVPEFVELLQRDWMHDDIVTLTNAFPDHEDVQGPAGADVAECIASFIPFDSTLFTSEVNFLPVFRHNCDERRTRMFAVQPRAADLIAGDLLDLFPYQEHPRNIALVGQLAEELGIDRHLAIATMAQHVVPDIGVLKVSHPARVCGRVLRFMNGMSANERVGFLNNWQRMGLDQLDPATSPAETIVTVVNNRRDRIPRSEVFARILVEDAVADVHVLIGTNLRGLRRYITESLRRHVKQLEVVVYDDIHVAGGTVTRPAVRLAQHLARLRIPPPVLDSVLARLELYARGTGFALDAAGMPILELAVQRLLSPVENAPLGPTDVRAEVAQELRILDGMLTALPDRRHAIPEVLGPASRAELMQHAVDQTTRIVIHARLQARLASVLARPSPAVVDAFHDAFRTAYRQLFLAQLIMLEDAGATGDAVIERCATAVPPGTNASVMGIQNIKGTGLDFVYRWAGLDQTMARLAVLSGDDPVARVEALRAMFSHEDYGLVESGVAAATLAVRATDRLDPVEQTEHKRTLARLQMIHRDRRQALARDSSRALGRRMVDAVLGAFDPLDSIRRRRKAAQVMADLVAHRISHIRAAKEMRALYERQRRI
ncbi:MAG: HEAT repeat domain-containing protein [Kofleriaceae bacterium]